MNTDNELNFSFDVNESNIQFNDIIKLEDIQRMQDLFSNATGVASLITNPKGIAITNPSNFCKFCEIIRNTEKGKANCIKSDSLNCSSISSEFKLQPCLSSGLWDSGVKISVNGIHIANWLIGQVRSKEINMQKITDYGVEIGANMEEYLEAFKQVPVMSEEKFHSVFEMMFVIANDISEKAYNNLQLKKQISESERMNELLQKNEKTLSITLHSIGDGVISTDKSGQIVNMNPIAENMCGWKINAALGKPLTDIFKIINSHTRLPVENPVHKVLEKGKIIGLANHTVLISKDGTEYHIADSAAPIKNNDGEITGVVLVFSDVTENYKAEERLRESERSKSVLLSNLPGIAYRCKYDPQWTMEFVSDGFLALTGYRTEEIIDNHTISFNDMILPEYHEYLWKVWEKAVKYHKNIYVEYQILTADNQVKWLLEQGIPIYNHAGKVEALEGFIMDITERKNIETTLQNERLLLRTLIDNIPDTIYAKDLSGRKILANKAEVELLGAKSETDVLGKNDFDFYSKEYADNFLADDQQVIKTGIPDLKREGFIFDSKGEKHWLISSKLPLRDKDGVIFGVMGISRDITIRKQAEEALRKSEAFLKETQVIAKLGTYTTDLIKNCWSSSEILDAIFGITPDFDKSFEGWTSLIHPDWQDIMSDYVINHVNGKRNKFDKRYKIIRQDTKEERWVHGLGELIFDDDQQPVLMIGTIQDITDRVNDEIALRESEEKYRNIFENVQDVFYQIDMKGIITEISPSVKYFSEFRPDEIVGKMADNLYVDAEKRVIMMHELSKKGELRDYELVLRTKSGVIRNVSMNARLIYDSKGKPNHIDGALRDITTRKMTEQALRESEKKFHDYIEYAPHGVFIADESGKYIEVNAAASRITGYSKEELMSMNQIDLISDESKETFVNHFKTAVENGFATDEFGLLRKDTSKGYISVDTVKLSEKLYLGFVVDITYRKLAEVELKENEDFLKKTQLIANLGNCILDLTSGSWISSEIMDSIVGIEPNFEKTFQSLASIVHPEWIELLKTHFIDSVVEKQTKFNTKFKIIRPVDLEERWVHTIGELKLDADDKPVKLIATVQDITERKLAAEALSLSDELHRSILNASPDAIIVVEMSGQIRMVSPAANILYGCKSSEQLIGRNMFDFITPEDRDRAHSNRSLMFNGYMGSIEYRIIRNDGSEFFAEVNGDIIWNSVEEPNGMVFIIRDVSDRKKAEDALKTSQVELKEFASHLQNVREEEKLQLAREIHDELGQILIAIKIDLGMMKQNVLKSIKSIDAENILTKFDNLFGLVDNTLNTTRKIMTDLRPEVLFLIGFSEAVKLYVNNFKERHKIICLFDNTVSKLELNSQQSVALYRILQESLTNIAKHAKATRVKIHLDILDGKLIMKVKDNGIGFKTNQKNKPNSYGLLGMKERVYLLDGDLHIMSLPGEGTTIQVEIPYVG
ncbi:MAG: PAS domain S-box protein [Paludibacter sp.]|nr:PAS domain S-box protein [Paludibacter sp.]